MPFTQVCRPVFVAPGGGGGTFADDDLFAFTSPVSAPVATETFLGGKNGLIASSTLGSDMNLASAGWVGPNDPSGGAGPGSYYPRADNAQTFHRTKVMGFDSAYHDGADPDNGCAFGAGYDCGLNYPELLVEWFMWYAANPARTQLQQKIFKEHTLPSIVDSSAPYTTSTNTAYFNWMSGGNQFVIAGGEGHFGGNTYFKNSGPDFGDNMPLVNSGNDGQWYRYRYYHKVSSATNSTDGDIRIQMWRCSDGTLVMDDHFTNHRDFKTGTTARYRYFNIQLYGGNADNYTSGAPPASGNLKTYLQDTKLRIGTGCQAYHVIGDASTFAACNAGTLTHQPATSWVGTACTVRINRNAVTFPKPWYLYAFDATGAIANSSGIAVT